MSGRSHADAHQPVISKKHYTATHPAQDEKGSLDDVGLASEWVLSRDQETVQPDEVVLRAHRGTRTIELRWAEMQRRLLLEMADLPMWG